MLAQEIFKAYDIRGIVDKTLTEDTVYAVGQGLGSMALEAGDEAIIIGRDGRLSGPRLAEKLAQGIISTGCDVIDVADSPTSLIYFAAFHLKDKFKTSSCVAVTGSHNPPEYNGLKMVIAGVTLSGESIQTLMHRILENKVKTGQGSLHQYNIEPNYYQRVVGDIKLKRPLKVVIDAGNGIAGKIAPKLFKSIGCEIETLYCEVDGNFPNHHPDPSRPENLTELIDKVKSSNADIGIAFDGDGDRLGVVSPNGSIIWPDRQMILYSRDILSRHPGATIIFDVKCSQLLPVEIRKAGGKPLMWKTGHSLIKAKLKETGALLAGEMSGHLFFKERWYGFDDGVYSGARLAEYLASETNNAAEVQELFDNIPDSVNTPEINIKTEEGQQHEVIKIVQEKADFDDGEVSTIDGLRVDYGDGFGLVRASNTTPCIVMRFEAQDREGLERIQKSFKDLFARALPDIDLPF